MLLKKEAVLCIAAVCAAVSAFFVPPDSGYRDYIDLRVLCLLFCLMTVVAGLKECGLFSVLAQRLLEGEKPVKLVLFLLVAIPFFVSMLVTNDVALITFVPFALLILKMANRRREMIPVVVLQTMAANLGSMATPVGNPQNLFLYHHYGLAPGSFFRVVAPLAALSFVFLSLLTLTRGKGRLNVRFEGREKIRNPLLFVLSLLLFVLCLASVFRLIPYWLVMLLVAGTYLLTRRKLLWEADYGLLLTFVCFFIFAGNLGRIGQISLLLKGLMEKSSLLVSAAASQVISNVPAAVLLSGFTEDWKGLLTGVNIGGLGTPVASLASLISLKIYLRQEYARPGRYLLMFTLYNLAGLALLLCAGLMMGGRMNG